MTIPGIGSWKPDVVGIAKDGTITLKEVQSPSQKLGTLENKVEQMATVLRKEGYKVKTEVIPYPKK